MKPKWFSHANQQMMFPHIMDDPDHEHHYWLSRHMISPLVGDFFETITRDLTGAKIIANDNGETARFGAADLIDGEQKLIIETKATTELRSDFTFGAAQLKDYLSFHEAGYKIQYYLWEYEKAKTDKLTRHRTEEKLFEFLAGATRRLIILDHETMWPLLPEEQLNDIWFDERDYVRLYKRILRPRLVLKGKQQFKINGFTLEYETHGIADNKSVDRWKHR